MRQAVVEFPCIHAHTDSLRMTDLQILGIVGFDSFGVLGCRSFVTYITYIRWDVLIEMSKKNHEDDMIEYVCKIPVINTEQCFLGSMHLVFYVT